MKMIYTASLVMALALGSIPMASAGGKCGQESDKNFTFQQSGDAVAKTKVEKKPGSAKNASSAN